ncbi:hypothetical protein H257_03450 [Aphanomyces astaci]|uniref:Tc1-like transposase DDE domain-containing protein n=1 Tax=Aphanomyces astaci TaxID=112090 RepID=W4GZ20_APHAT|nr:hypothetical protein H257_03450 [Aphanomyces astaci]ETV84163.1 hypothetical protein H257_03450 [Aphanomyces astaci]|eukprot:XP_009825855.1 hypothetical protein H257_03450 [Aphanomyces astaci]
MERVRTGRELTESMKMVVVKQLQHSLNKGKLAHGVISTAASHFKLYCSTVARIWKTFLLGDIENKNVIKIVREIPQSQRSTMRNISEATGLSTARFSRSLKAGTLEHCSSRLKPLLTEANQLERIVFCGSHVRREAPDIMLAETIDQIGDLQECPFQEMWDIIHLNEKHLDGKIGMWPIEEQVPAMRNSRNRAAGTMVTTLVNVNTLVYQDFVLNKVVPAIKAKFPSANKQVVLQHDNAKPHRSINSAVFQGVSTDGWTFVVRCQPLNSPYLNVLDLGFFASIQAQQYKSFSIFVDDVIRATMGAFDPLCSNKLEDVYLTLQVVMRLVLHHLGGNQFRLPHLKKEAMRRAGTLMAIVTCPLALLYQADLHLQHHGIPVRQIQE